ncbi:MAG: hypothetical protein LBC20_13765 [Planctomycetaceae bacterium]|jgi:hypothetical protein|nr:hypothetical protein [Planctomycetaceae bacterium]
MRFFLIKPVLGSIVFLCLMLFGVWEVGISYGVDSIAQTSYQTSPEIISETVPIRVGETVLSYDFPYEPQIIKRQIISTRIVSPPAISEIKTINDKPLLPLRQTEKKEETTEKIEKKENNVLPEEKPFQEITFPPLSNEEEKEEPDRIINLKPTQPLQNEPNNIPKQTPSVSSTVLGQSSSFAREVEKLEEPLLSPRGLVDASAIDPKLYENTAENKETSEQNKELMSTTENNSTAISKEPSEENKSKNEKQNNRINGILLLVTIVSVTMLIYAVVIAFDYHQRWIQSLTTQNNRFSGISDSGFSGEEMDMDADFSGNIPLYNGNSNIPAGLSHFRSESPYY